MRTTRLDRSRRHSSGGSSLVEVMMAAAAGALVLASGMAIFIYALFSFAGMGNYAILTGQSRKSLDRMSRELREATQIVGVQQTGTTKSLSVTNAYSGSLIRYQWNSRNGLLTRSLNNQEDEVCLTGCDAWDFTMYQRAPTNRWTFYPTTSMPLCKLVNMSWKCSRTILGEKINTENVVTAQIVLRNKP